MRSKPERMRWKQHIYIIYTRCQVGLFLLYIRVSAPIYRATRLFLLLPSFLLSRSLSLSLSLGVKRRIAIRTKAVLTVSRSVRSRAFSVKIYSQRESCRSSCFFQSRFSYIVVFRAWKSIRRTRLVSFQKGHTHSGSFISVFFFLSTILRAIRKRDIRTQVHVTSRASYIWIIFICPTNSRALYFFSKQKVNSLGGGHICHSGRHLNNKLVYYNDTRGPRKERERISSGWKWRNIVYVYEGQQ